MIPSRKRRDHNWKKWFEVKRSFHLEHPDGNTYEKEMTTVAANEEEADKAGFICFAMSLMSEGVHIPRLLRSENDDSRGGEGESP